MSNAIEDEEREGLIKFYGYRSVLDTIHQRLLTVNMYA